MRKKTRGIISIVVTIIIVGILMVSGLQLFGVINVLEASDYHTGISPSSINNCDTVHGMRDVWTGQAIPGYDGYPNTEMMPDTKYITSFSGADGDDALSERINIQGNCYENAFFESQHPTRGYYKVYIKTDPQQSGWTQIVGLSYYDSTKVVVSGGTGWRGTYHYDVSGVGDSEFVMTGIEIRLKGSIVGALKTEAVMEMHGGWPFFPLIDEKVMATDYAYLASGNGRINIEGHTPQDVPMYEIGATVPIHVEADYSGMTAGGTGRWQLWAFPLRGGSGRLLKEWTYDYFRETYQWTLPLDAWVRGASDSKWRLELHNTLFSTDAVMINTIDVKANAPPTPTVTTTPTNPQVGQAITIDMSAATNSLTNELIEKFIVRGIYTDNNFQFVYKDVTIISGHADPFIATTTITPPRAGVFKLQIWAHDAGSRESVMPYEKTITAHEGQYRLTITVNDQFNSLPLEGVRVQQTGAAYKTTNSLGIVWFDLNAGSYEFQFTKAGYRTKSQSWTITSADRDVTLNMERTTNTWSLDVTVKTEDGNTVWGASVKVGGTEKLTDQTGVANFKDIAEGDYTVTAKHENLSGSQKITLDRSKAISITITEGGGLEGNGTDWSQYLIYFIIGGVVLIGAFYGIMYYLKKKRQMKR